MDAGVAPAATQDAGGGPAAANGRAASSSQQLSWGGIGGFGSGLGLLVLEGAEAPTTPERPPPEVNVGAVVENPREIRPSLLAELLSLGHSRVGQAQPPLLTVLPEVTRKDFADYVSQLRVARLRAGLSTADAVLHDDETAVAPSVGSGEEHAMTMLHGSADAASDNVVTTLSPSHARLVHAGVVGADRHIVSIAGSSYHDEFQIVPQQFFMPEFDIGRADTFTAVLTDAGVRRGDGAAAITALERVQDRFSAYLDVVECQLHALIRSRSRQFFDALRDLQELQLRVQAAYAVGADLAARIARIKSEASVQPLFVVHATRRRQRGAALCGSLILMLQAKRATASVAQLLSAGNLSNALDVIRATRLLIATRLQRVVAVSGMTRQLAEYEHLIGDTFVANFVRQATTIAIIGGMDDSEAGSGSAASPTKAAPSVSLEAFVSGAASGATLSAATSIAAPTTLRRQQQVDEALSGHVRPSLEGLVRTGRLGAALEAFQDALVRELRMLVRAEVAEAVAAAEDAVDVSTVRAVIAAVGSSRATSAAAEDITPERLNALQPAAFARVLSSLTSSLTDALRRVSAIEELVENVLDAHATHAPEGGGFADAIHAQSSDAADAAVVWPVALSRLRALSSGVVAVAVDAGTRHVARLLALRRDAGARSRIADIKALWTTSTAFTAASHALLAHAGGAYVSSSTGDANRMQHTASPVLDECLATARALLEYQHSRNSRSLTAMLDGEPWRQADVPPAVQALVDAIAASGGGSSDRHAAGPTHAQFASPNLVQVAAAATDGISVLPTVPEAAGQPGDAPVVSNSAVASCLVVRGMRYPVVGTALMLLKMLGDYASLAEALPDLAGDVIRATVELLRSFNSRTTQLLLMAGAMQTAQLKRITAKHLALAVQSLGALLALLPAVRASLIMRLPPQQASLLSELARVTADLMAHENALLAKFVEIVKELLCRCVDDMVNVPWGDESVSITVPTAPMRELCKGVTTLQKILSPVLRPAVPYE